MYFAYGEAETSYLKKRDKRLGEAIERIGHIERAVDEDLFSSVVHHIVGQQISAAAQRTIWARIRALLGRVDAQAVLSVPIEQLQACGITHKKAGYIRAFAEQVASGELDLMALNQMDDAQLAKTLSRLPGIGVWTAEMIMTFCLQRGDILSYGDLAIHRGLRMLYRHRKVDKALFEKYRRRYSPCGTVASLYLWAIAGGAIAGLTDPGVRK